MIREELSALLSHHAAFELPTRLGGFAFAAKRGRFKILAPFNFLHDSISFALALKAAQGFLNSFIVTQFNQNQGLHHLPFFLTSFRHVVSRNLVR
jgi:hypothetical protein